MDKRKKGQDMFKNTAISVMAAALVVEWSPCFSAAPAAEKACCVIGFAVPLLFFCIFCEKMAERRERVERIRKQLQKLQEVEVGSIVDGYIQRKTSGNE